jgi:hypothetical protein
LPARLPPRPRRAPIAVGMQRHRRHLHTCRPRGSYLHHRLVIDRCRWARSLRLPHSTARHDNLTCICCASPAQSTTAATTAPQCGSHSRAGSAPLCLSSIRRSIVGCALAPNAPVRCIQHRTCIGIRAAAALPTAPPQCLPACSHNKSASDLVAPNTTHASTGRNISRRSCHHAPRRASALAHLAPTLALAILRRLPRPSVPPSHRRLHRRCVRSTRFPLACRSRSTPARAQQEHHRSRDVHVTLALHASSPQRQVPARGPTASLTPFCSLHQPPPPWYPRRVAAAAPPAVTSSSSSSPLTWSAGAPHCSAATSPYFARSLSAFGLLPVCLPVSQHLVSFGP